MQHAELMSIVWYHKLVTVTIINLIHSTHTQCSYMRILLDNDVRKSTLEATIQSKWAELIDSVERHLIYLDFNHETISTVTTTYPTWYTHRVAHSWNYLNMKNTFRKWKLEKRKFTIEWEHKEAKRYQFNVMRWFDWTISSLKQNWGKAVYV